MNYNNIIKILQPYRVQNYNKVRVGSPNDGGYIMLDDFEVRAAISGGIGVNDVWERDISNRGIKVEGFDPDVELSRTVPYNIYKEPLRIYDTNNTALDVILSGYDEYETIVKLDIEGFEFPLLMTTQNDSFRKIRQLVGEFHFSHFPNFIERPELFYNVFEKLNQYFVPIHLHGNNNCGHFKFDYMNTGRIVTMPFLLEITYVNRDFYKNFIKSDESFPTELDAPCFPGRGEDIQLGKFDF